MKNKLTQKYQVYLVHKNLAGYTTQEEVQTALEDYFRSYAYGVDRLLKIKVKKI